MIASKGLCTGCLYLMAFDEDNTYRCTFYKNCKPKIISHNSDTVDLKDRVPPWFCPMRHKERNNPSKDYKREMRDQLVFEDYSMGIATGELMNKYHLSSARIKSIIQRVEKDRELMRYELYSKIRSVAPTKSIATTLWNRLLSNRIISRDMSDDEMYDVMISLTLGNIECMHGVGPKLEDLIIDVINLY